MDFSGVTKYYNLDSSGANKSVGYGSEGESQTSITKSAINTSNIKVTDQKAQKATGTGTEEIIAQVHIDTSTDTIEADSGALVNNFDAVEVQKELDVQTRVTQTFDTTRQEVKSYLNTKIDNANEIIEDKSGKYTKEQIAEAYKTVEDMQQLGVLVDSISGALYTPADDALGTVANTLSPAIVYEIGQYFKENEFLNTFDNGDRAEEGSPQHILAQALVAGLVAQSAGNDALSAAISAGGAEVLAPELGRWLYGEKDPSKLTSEQKETISAIISLGSGAIGATTDSNTDVISSSVAGATATEDNSMMMPYWTPSDILRATALQNGSIEEKIKALIEAGLTKEEIEKTLANDAAFKSLTKDGDEIFDSVYTEQKEKVDSLNAQIDDIILALEVSGIAVMFIDGAIVKTTDIAAKKLIKEALEQGLKISPENIVSIAKIDGKIVWLETGSTKAGLEHIVARHADDFAKLGIKESSIPNFILSIVKNSKPLGTYGKDGSVFKVLVNGETKYINVVIGENGFIVTAYPIRVNELSRVIWR